MGFVGFLDDALEPSLYKVASELLAVRKSSEPVPLWFLREYTRNTLFLDFSGLHMPFMLRR